MIAADTSTWIAYLQGASGDDTLLLDQALQDRQLVMVPVVLTELLSDSQLPPTLVAALNDVPLLPLQPGFWRRAGALRAKVLSTRRRARLGDSLIAQTCLDAHIPLITRDGDFRAFALSSRAQLVLLP